MTTGHTITGHRSTGDRSTGGRGTGDGGIADPTPSDGSGLYDRERRCELLAAAEADELEELMARCVEGTEGPRAVSGPDVGMVMLTVREPVESTRFHLGEVLVTRTEVEHRGVRGWAMRMGDDCGGSMAAAVADAEAEADGPAGRHVQALCAEVERRSRAQDAAEWAELEPTIVSFDGLDPMGADR